MTSAAATPLSRHAQARMQQRGISTELLGLLAVYGARAHDHHGGQLRFFDKAARRRLRQAAGEAAWRRVESKLDVYAVIAQDGCVVTVGHRDRRIARH